MAVILAACAHSSALPKLTLNVMTSGGFTAAYNQLAPNYSRESHINLVPTYGASMGGASDSIPARLARNETADVVILARNGIDDLAYKGFVDPASITDLARSQIGMAVKSGAPVPDISTRAAFLNVLLSAKSIGYSASASGTYLANDLFPKLEIYPQIRSKLVRIESERVAAVVARGDVEIGFQQVSEILPIPGASFAGKLPEEMQRTTTFSAGIGRMSTKKKEAARLIAYLASPQSAPTISSTGLDPVVPSDQKR
ncbi:MAG TPA: molybdenum ABC transporter substrate-binding protein [Hyphomonadaceae bacterium]|nr:molybdenum ABC transporter substrate-binding protein [Hyphomonadaceae bacterium]